MLCGTKHTERCSLRSPPPQARLTSGTSMLEKQPHAGGAHAASTAPRPPALPPRWQQQPSLPAAPRCRRPSAGRDGHCCESCCACVCACASARRCCSACRMSASYPCGSRLSACRKSTQSPLARRHPALSCAPRPRGAATTRAPARRASERVASRLPPSTTIASSGGRAPGVRFSNTLLSAAPTLPASFCGVNGGRALQPCVERGVRGAARGGALCCANFGVCVLPCCEPRRRQPSLLIARTSAGMTIDQVSSSGSLFLLFLPLPHHQTMLACRRSSAACVTLCCDVSCRCC